MKILVDVVREKKGVSQKGLAEKSGIARSHLQKIESGISMPTIRTICKIARALGVSPEELYSCKE